VNISISAEISEPVAASARPPSLFATIRSLLPELSMPKLKLPAVKLPTLKLLIRAPSLQLVTPKVVRKEPEPLHYARTPLATYARVKSRLQDRPPLVAAFADQVSVLNPSSLVPKQTLEGEISTGQPSRNLRTSFLFKNLRDLLPTPIAALLTFEAPRKRSLISILGGRAAKKVVAEIEVINISLLAPLHFHTFLWNFVTQFQVEDTICVQL